MLLEQKIKQREKEKQWYQIKRENKEKETMIIEQEEIKRCYQSKKINRDKETLFLEQKNKLRERNYDTSTK